MKGIFNAIIAFWVSFLLAGEGFAAGESSSSFLKIGIGAKATSMGEAFVALSDDPSAIHWNPAGLTQLERRALTFMHNEWIYGINHNFIGYAHPINDGEVLGVALTGLYINDLRRREDSVEAILGDNDTFGAYDGGLILSFGKKIKNSLSLGISLKGIYQQIDDKRGNTLALDVGSLICAFSNLKVGFVIQNVGPAMKIYSKRFHLPLNVGIGASYRLIDKATLAVAVNKPLDDEISLHFGGEYRIGYLSLRGGYKYREGDGNLSFGFGLNVRAYQVDYSYLSCGENLGLTHKLSLTIEL